MKKIFYIFISLAFYFSLASETLAADANLFLEPGSGGYQVTDLFAVKIRVNGDGVTINAARTTVSFPSAILEIIGLSKSGSIFQLWPEEPSYSNTKGEVNFAGGVPTPGFTGIGTILTINFRAKKAGEAKVSFSNSQVLAADGRGTDIFAFAEGGNYIILQKPGYVPEEAKPEEKPSAPEEILLSAPEILVYPKVYAAGEETFYVEGQTIPKVKVLTSLKKDDKLIKVWEAQSDDKGSWTILTSEFFKPGNYTLSARAKDSEGRLSESSPEYQVRVIFAGIIIGSWIITYSVLLFSLIMLIILLAIIIIFIIILRIRKDRNKLRNETLEAKESLKKNFAQLRKYLEERIEYLDSKPGLSPEEKRLRDELFAKLKISEETINKEIKDIEKELE